MRWVLGFHTKQDNYGSVFGVLEVEMHYTSYRSLGGWLQHYLTMPIAIGVLGKNMFFVVVVS